MEFPDLFLIFRDTAYLQLWNMSTEEDLPSLPSSKLFGEQVCPSEGRTPQRAWMLHNRKCEYSPSLRGFSVTHLSKDTQVFWKKNYGICDLQGPNMRRCPFPLQSPVRVNVRNHRTIALSFPSRPLPRPKFKPLFPIVPSIVPTPFLPPKKGL